MTKYGQSRQRYQQSPKQDIFTDCRFNILIESKIMSEPKKERPVVPEGESRNVKTRQMKPNEKGFVGYETVWESFQKETTYQTPKKP